MPKYCCGRIWEISDYFIKAGYDAYESIQPTAGMDIGEVKEKYGDGICLLGNVDCSQLLPFGIKE